MARFSDEWLAELLSKNDITDVIGSRITLVRRGERYWAECPWHPEKKASFTIHPGRQLFHCFSCKRGGSVINFIMEYDNLTFMEAVERLADRVGMVLPEKTNDQEYQKMREYKKKLMALMRDAAVFYHSQLKSSPLALDYISKRGIKEQVMRFGLGYSPNSYNITSDYLKEKGYTPQELMDAGLVRFKDGKMYDTFRGRVMFPIQNTSSEVIAFGGRIIGEGEPKYLNSSETLLFNKRKNLYALNLVKKHSLKSLLLVEGYMDVVALSSVGIQTAVASLGTALTPDQARLIKRYVGNVYICYDGDNAGQNASVRAVDVLRHEGLNVNVITLPDELDPDDFAKKYGANALYSLAKKALPGTAFKLSRLKSEFDLSRDQVAYATRAMEILKSLDNELEKEQYLKQISEETGLSERGLFSQLERETGREKNEQRYNIPSNELNLYHKPTDEQSLICSLIDEPELAEQVSINAEDFTDDMYKKIFLYILSQIKKGFPPSSAEIIAQFPNIDEQSGIMSSVRTSTVEHVERLALSLRRSALQKQKLELLASTGSANANRMEILKQIEAINFEISKLQVKKPDN